MNELDDIQVEIQEQEETLHHLKKDTFGIFLQTSEDGKTLVLPNNIRIETKWTTGTET